MAAHTDAVPARPAWYEGRHARWLVASDHKAIGSLYVWTALLYLGLAVVGSLIMRAHTGRPGAGGDVLFTLHLGAAAFLVLVPLAIGLATYVVPLQIGARGIVAPQVASFAYWLYALGGLALVLTFYSAGTGDCGWSCSGALAKTGDTGDLWLLTIALLAAATILACCVLLATISRRAAPGMTSRTWAPLTRATSLFSWLLIPLAGLAIADSILLLLARHGSVHFSAETMRHLAWAYGWPEIALLLIPALAIVAEVWRAAVPPAALIGAIGAVLTVVVAVGGALVLTSLHGQPFDLHYVLAIADYAALSFVVLALFAGLHYWWPKLFGRKLDDGVGTTSAWLLVLGVNLGFFPAYLASAHRVYGYPEFTSWNMFARVSMLGAGVFAAGVLVFLFNVLRTHALRQGARAGNDPWRADTLEWLTTSPPPAHNFDRLPPITSARPLRDLRASLEARGER